MEELLIYIDPGFLESVGHYKSFAENIHSEAEKRRVDVWHIVNSGVSDEAAARYSLERAFRYRALLREPLDAYPGMRKFALMMVWAVLDRVNVMRRFEPKGLLTPRTLAGLAADLVDGYNKRVLRSFAGVLEQVVDRVLMSDYEKISIYMYTSHPLYFPVFGRLINSERYRGLNVKAHLGLFYLNLGFCRGERAPKYEEMLSDASEALEGSDPVRKVSICADSGRTIVRYSPCFRRPLKRFPIPLGRRGRPLGKADDWGRRPSAQEAAGEKLRIGFFGYTHKKQGYHLVSGLYREIAKSGRYPHVHFVVRHNINFIDHDGEMKKVVEGFRKETGQIEHLVGDFSKGEYERHLSNCDIILIPHSRDEYPCQTSGLFVDSLKKGKVVVVPDNTWMSDTLEGHGSGETFRSDDLASFTDAVKMVCDNFPSYRGGSGRNIEAFSRFHTVETLFDVMEIGKLAYIGAGSAREKGGVVL